jgi:hypothetical protein
VNTHINLLFEAASPRARFLTSASGEAFIALTIGGFDAILPGADAAAVASARAIAAALGTAACALEAEIERKAVAA